MIHLKSFSTGNEFSKKKKCCKRGDVGACHDRCGIESREATLVDLDHTLSETVNHRTLPFSRHTACHCCCVR